MTPDVIGFLIVSSLHAAFWFWVYFRLETNVVARRVWEATWLRWTSWQNPIWVLIFAILMAALTLLVAYACMFPEHASTGRP